MGTTGGSIGSLSINGRNFSVDGDVDAAQALKKFENEMKANGDGTIRLIKKRQVQKLEALPVAINDSQNDLEFLSDLNDNGDGGVDGLFNITVALASGAIYSGRGQFVGDMMRQTSESTAELTLNLSSMKKQ